MVIQDILETFLAERILLPGSEKNILMGLNI